MNDENAYNLIDEPWIPVLMRDGKNGSVSLGEVFADADGTIADLALNPYERVAVFRLLLCIAQAALGPERLKDEREWKAVKNDIGPAGTLYLKKWNDRFFLYGPHAFMQPDDVETVQGTAKQQFNSTVSKLCFACATGENSTLFDHEAFNRNRGLSDSERAVSFLVFQSFSAGGRFSQCRWNGTLTPSNNNEGKPNSVWSAPCRENDMLFSILIGDNLLESIWMNLLTADMLASGQIKFGVPIWEQGNLTREAVDFATWTYLGHLVPLSRIAKLFPGDNGIVLGEGLVYPTLNPNKDKKMQGKRSYGWREPMATVKPNGDDLPDYVSSDPTRLPWRDLASILAVDGNNGSKSALALQHCGSLADEKEFVLWMGGLCTDQAKDIAVVEWTARLSLEWLEDPQINRYKNKIDLSDKQATALYLACKTYALFVKTSPPTEAIKNKDETKLVSPFSTPAERAYWDILAQPANQRLVQNVESKTYWDDWKDATRRAAEEAYRRACPAMNARQMEAFAQGFAKLWVRDDTKKKSALDADSDDNEEKSNA